MQMSGASADIGMGRHVTLNDDEVILRQEGKIAKEAYQILEIHNNNAVIKLKPTGINIPISLNRKEDALTFFKTA